jgi:hypothetical protein
VLRVHPKEVSTHLYQRSRPSTSSQSSLPTPDDAPLTYGLLKSCLEASLSSAIAPLRSELTAVSRVTAENTESIDVLRGRVTTLENQRSSVVDSDELLRRQRCAEQLFVLRPPVTDKDFEQLIQNVCTAAGLRRDLILNVKRLGDKMAIVSCSSVSARDLFFTKSKQLEPHVGDTRFLPNRTKTQLAEFKKKKLSQPVLPAPQLDSGLNKLKRHLSTGSQINQTTKPAKNMKTVTYLTPN